MLRERALAYIFSSAIFFSSFIMSTFLGLIYALTGNSIYKTIQIYLPTSPANSLPIQYALPNLPSNLSQVLRFINTDTVVPTIELSITILITYTLVSVVIAAAYFLFADISRKLS
jgi:hypothetical protein